MFAQYILGSPSLWYGKRVMFDREKAFAATHKDLKARHYPGLQFESRVFADEDHLTLAPGLITRGLKWTLPGKK